MTSARQQGNRSENAFCAIAEQLGYATFCARGSRGPVDVLCFEWRARHAPRRIDAETTIVDDAPLLPPLAVQVGTTGKAIATTLAGLVAARRPIGSLCIVARRHIKKRRVVWTFHTKAGTFQTLDAAIATRA